MKLLSAEQMAELIGCSDKTFRKIVKEQGLPFYQFGRLKRFNADEILARTKTKEVDKEVVPEKKKSPIEIDVWTDKDRQFAKEIGLTL